MYQSLYCPLPCGFNVATKGLQVICNTLNDSDYSFFGTMQKQLDYGINNHKYFLMEYIFRDHSFPPKILPNSVGQFANSAAGCRKLSKFRSSLWPAITGLNRDTVVPAEGNGDLQTLICVLVATPRRCPTLS